MGPVPQQRQPDVPRPSGKKAQPLPSPHTVAAQGLPPPTVLPQRSRTIVLATSESEYETYSEDDEWDSGDEVEIPKGKTSGTSGHGGSGDAAVTVGANGVAAGAIAGGVKAPTPGAVAKEAEQRRLNAQLQVQMEQQLLQQRQQQQQVQAQQQTTTTSKANGHTKAAGQVRSIIAQLISSSED